MAVKKKSTAKKPVKKVVKKAVAKKAVAKKAVAKKAVAKKKSAKRVVKKTTAKKPVKKVAKKAAVKKTAKKPVKKSAKKSSGAAKIIVPPVPLSGATRSDRTAQVTTAPSKPSTPVASSAKPSSAPKQATSNRVLFAAIVGIALLAILVISNKGSDDNDNAAPKIPAASQSAEPTGEASAEPSSEATEEPMTVTSVEAPGRFIGNWKDADRTIMSLTWRAPSATDGLTGYKVEARSNMGEWKVISELPATTLSFEMTKMSPDGSTSFKVSSVYSDGQVAEAKAFGFAGQFE